MVGRSRHAPAVLTGQRPVAPILPAPHPLLQLWTTEAQVVDENGDAVWSFPVIWILSRKLRAVCFDISDRRLDGRENVYDF